MRRKKVVYLCIWIVVLFCIAVIFYFIGYEKSLKENQTESFNAVITEIGENYSAPSLHH